MITNILVSSVLGFLSVAFYTILLRNMKTVKPGMLELFIEFILVSGLFMISTLKLPFGQAWIFVAIFTFILSIIALLDSKTQTIPDYLSVLLGLFSVISFFMLNKRFPDSVLGLLAGGGVLLVIDTIAVMLLKKDGFGYGDVKLMAAVGIFLGFKLTILSLLLSFVSCGFFVIICYTLGRIKKGDYIAFGPFLALGSFLSCLYGSGIINWYSEILNI